MKRWVVCCVRRLSPSMSKFIFQAHTYTHSHVQTCCNGSRTTVLLLHYFVSEECERERERTTERLFTQEKYPKREKKTHTHTHISLHNMVVCKFEIFDFFLVLFFWQSFLRNCLNSRPKNFKKKEKKFVLKVFGSLFFFQQVL